MNNLATLRQELDTLHETICKLEDVGRFPYPSQLRRRTWLQEHIAGLEKLQELKRSLEIHSKPL